MYVQRDHIRLSRHNDAENQQTEQQVFPAELEACETVGDKQTRNHLQRHTWQQDAQRVGQSGTVVHQAEGHFEIVHLQA